MPGFVIEEWYGIVAPAKTDKAHIDRINDEVRKALTQADIKDKLATLGAEAAAGSSDAFGALRKPEPTTITVVQFTSTQSNSASTVTATFPAALQAGNALDVVAVLVEPEAPQTAKAAKAAKAAGAAKPAATGKEAAK